MLKANPRSPDARAGREPGLDPPAILDCKRGGSVTVPLLSTARLPRHTDTCRRKDGRLGSEGRGPRRDAVTVKRLDFGEEPGRYSSRREPENPRATGPRRPWGSAAGRPSLPNPSRQRPRTPPPGDRAPHGRAFLPKGRFPLPFSKCPEGPPLPRAGNTCLCAHPALPRTRSWRQQGSKEETWAPPPPPWAAVTARPPASGAGVKAPAVCTFAAKLQPTQPSNGFKTAYQPPWLSQDLVTLGKVLTGLMSRRKGLCS